MENDKTIIKREILNVMDKHPTFGKHQIFSMVSQNLNIPRPIVRRIARELRIDLMKRLLVLQSDEMKSDNKVISPMKEYTDW